MSVKESTSMFVQKLNETFVLLQSTENITIHVQEWFKTKVSIINDLLGNLNTFIVLVDGFVA